MFLGKMNQMAWAIESLYNGVADANFIYLELVSARRLSDDNNRCA